MSLLYLPLATVGVQAEQVHPLIGGRSKTLARVGFGMIDEFLAIQWLLVCRHR